MDETYGTTCARVPADIVNFQHDPLACAIALGWSEGVEIKEVSLAIEEEGGIGFMSESTSRAGVMRVVTRVDGPRFSEFWVRRITRVENYRLRILDGGGMTFDHKSIVSPVVEGRHPWCGGGGIR